MPWLSTCFSAGVDDRTDQDRDADRRAGGADAGVGLLVVERVDGGGVLRPEDEVRPRDLAGLDPVGEVDRGVDVVLGHLAVVVEDVVPVAGHVALHHGDRHRAVAVCVPRQHDRHRQQGAQPDQATPRRVRRASAADDHPRQQRAEQGEQEAHADRADVRQRLGDRSVDDAEREAAPRHPAERPAAAPHLDGGPRGGEPQRPEPVPLDHRGERTHQRRRRATRRPPARARRRCPTARIQTMWVK